MLRTGSVRYRKGNANGRIIKHLWVDVFKWVCDGGFQR